MSKKDKQKMVAIPWVTEECTGHKNTPDELWETLLALAEKYGIGGLLAGVSIFCNRARGTIYGRSISVIGQKIFSFVVEMSDEIERNLLEEEEKGSPLVHAVKSKLIN